MTDRPWEGEGTDHRGELSSWSRIEGEGQPIDHSPTSSDITDEELKKRIEKDKQ